MPSVLFSKIDSHAVSQVIGQAQLARDSLFWRLDWDLSAKKRIVGDGKNFSFENREFTESILAAHGISLNEWDS
jgi:hypothetical protein